MIETFVTFCSIAASRNSTFLMYRNETAVPSSWLMRKPLPCALLLLYHFQTVNAVSFHAWVNSLSYRLIIFKPLICHTMKHAQANKKKNYMPRNTFYCQTMKKQSKTKPNRKKTDQNAMCTECCSLHYFWTCSKYVRPINFYMLI